ncbi:MAG TPA: 4Fe-4S dicluster domain-containing protein [Methylomusa anaerophila]|uniref:Iron-sulfur protein n=1 Tax=Methylomusa anaerophila TaxID=1930071 RepID=A0A348ALV2_9FIRM|nr:4Fe-4S dicluster domain-containing protein [Methylomusa anaerophila]BBB92050.1 iron-sulfur protein [Methylomusa anaerophila]HML87938.1 4Fe-4S dicluster domain-containing protein [Methylomusa anaerophila]
MQKEILIRPERCMGCHSCEIACTVAHSPTKTLVGALLTDKPPRKQIYVEQVDGFKAPIACRHCEDAPCVDICMTHSLHRTPDGRVTNSDRLSKCLGCWMCIMACPFGVIRKDGDERRAVKCDRECLDETDSPACVRACPTGALVYATVADFAAVKRRSQVPLLTAAGKE